MVCAPVRSIIPSLKLGDYLPVQAHKPCCISLTYYEKHFKHTRTHLVIRRLCSLKLASYCKTLIFGGRLILAILAAKTKRAKI